MQDFELADLDQHQAEAREWYKRSDPLHLANLQFKICLDDNIGLQKMADDEKTMVLHLANLKLRELALEYNEVR